MLWIILGAIIGLIIGITISSREYWVDWVEHVFMCCVLTILCATIGILAMLMSSAIADCSAEKTWYIVNDTDIYALQDNITTEGQFFLGSGHIDEELQYFYVEETEYGYTISNVDADKSYIKYSDGRCHVEERAYTFDNAFVRLIAIPMNSHHYIFYIPEGSVVNNYSVDLK